MKTEGFDLNAVIGNITKPITGGKVNFDNLKHAILQADNAELVIDGYRFTADAVADTITIRKIN